MPLLLIIGAGALLGLAAYAGVHVAAHLLRKIPYFSNWPILKSADTSMTWKGALAATAAGAVALPLTIVGAGAAGAALGVEFLPPAIGTAAGTVASVGGELVDHLGLGHDSKPATPVAKPLPQTRPITPTAPAQTNTTPAPTQQQTTPPRPVVEHPLPVVKPLPKPIAQEPPAQKTPPVAPSTKEHVVVKGDTLSEIAVENHVSLSSLEQANPAIGKRKAPIAFKSSWDFIKPGDVVEVPTTPPPPSKTTGAAGALGKISLGSDK
ncbi:MAG TPA: LysM peptidoglycan-binding domain-containing protein [Planctomycetota bacterium]|nr:LysM peptidoglycan-binding domain-containing protein [Planctomycetota bacterium]